MSDGCACFFRNMGFADQLGSGVRNLFKYSKFYSGKEPEFKEGDVFRITVPLDDAYSYDFGSDVQKKADKKPIKADKKAERESLIIAYIKEQGSITNIEARTLLGLADSTTKRILKEMVESDFLIIQGERKMRRYLLKE